MDQTNSGGSDFETPFGTTTGRESTAGTTWISSGSMSGGSTDSEICPHCGQATNRSGGLEQFLGRLGISDEMMSNLKNQMQNVDIDEYLNTARDYLKSSGTKAGSFAKENPGKIAAGVAALALGAGLIYAAKQK